MFTIQRAADTPYLSKNISISLDNENHNLSINAFYKVYKKNGIKNGNIYIELVKNKEPNKRTIEDDTLIKLELLVEDENEVKNNINGFVKNIENIINKNMSESLKEKVNLIDKLVNKYSDRLSNNKNAIYINPDYKEAIKEENKNTQNNNNNVTYNNSGESFTDKFNRIPLAYVIEKLAEMNVISLEKDKKPNGDEDFYWIESEKLPKASKVSVLAIRTIENQSGNVIKKYKHCRDLNNNKLSTTSAMGLLYSLEREGCTGGREAGELAGEIIRNSGGFKAFPLIDEENETMTYGEGGSTVSIVSLELQSRLPSIHNTKKSQDYKDYLINQRMIDSSIIEREFNTKEIKTGSFYSHENYMYGSIGLFTLKYFDNEYKKTYERFSFDQEGKLNRGHLSNIPIKGRSHIIKNEGAKATIFTEAVIDNYSMENLMEISPNHNSKDYNYVGLTSVGNIMGWFEHNLNIKLQFKEDPKTKEDITKIMYIDRQEEVLENQEEEIEKLAKAIKTKRLHYIHDKKTKWSEKTSSKVLFRLQKVLEKIDPEIQLNVIELDKNNYKVDYNIFDKGSGCNDYILDSTNVIDFLERNNIKSKYNPEVSDYDVEIVSRKEKWLELTEENMEIREKIKRRVHELTGTTNFIFSFDNDMAALPKTKHLYKVCEFFNLGYSSTIPTFEHNINDNNDILKTYKTLLNQGNEEDANNLLNGFLSQIQTNKNRTPENMEELMKESTRIELKKKGNAKNKRKP